MWWMKHLGPKENSLSPFETSKYEFLLIRKDKNVKAWHVWFALVQPEKGTPRLTEALLHYFSFTQLYKAEFKALSTSIIKAIYTKKKYTYLQKHTAADFSMILCALHFETLQFTNGFPFKTLCRRAFSAITYSNRLSVMWVKFIRHLGLSSAFLPHTSQSRAQKNKQKKNGHWQHRMVLLWE